MSNSSISFAITARSDSRPAMLFTPVIILSPQNFRVAKANALWDTGASVCSISKDLADFLGLKYTPGPPLNRLGGIIEATYGYTYVSLVAGGGAISVICAVVENINGLGCYSFIIGLNLISLGQLSISRAGEGLVLSFRIPGGEPTDYAGMAPEDMARAEVPLSKGSERVETCEGIEAYKLMLESMSDEAMRKMADELSSRK